MLGAKGQKAVHACMIRLLNLGPAKHEKVAIYAVNQRISNVCRIAPLQGSSRKVYAPLRSVLNEHPLDVLHLMFGGSQVQRPYRASTNGFLTYSNSAKYCTRSDSSEREILRQKSLPCVGTPADFILVFRTLPNRLGRIILLNRYKLYHQEIREGK